MMLPWIIVGWLRAIVGTFCFIAVFAFPIGSCAQVFLFVSLSIYYGERFSANQIIQLSKLNFELFQP
jgi:hypothetical protein